MQRDRIKRTRRDEGMIHALSLVSGIGGIDRALRLVYGHRYRTLAYGEIDPFCQDVLLARMADGFLDRAPIFGDLRAFDARGFRGAVDLVHAGLPCQPYSVAGKRVGHDDPRGWSIVEHAIRVIGECRPAVVFFENVPTWVTGGWFRRCGEALSELGYRIESPFFCRASDVGAPHRRERVFILAHLFGARWRSETGSNVTDQRSMEAEDHQGRGERSRVTVGRSEFVGGTVGDTSGRGEKSVQQPRSARGAESPGDALADPSGPRLEGRLLTGLPGDADGQPPAWPPGPQERDRWAAVLARWPELAPAVADAGSQRVMGRGRPAPEQNRDESQDGISCTDSQRSRVASQPALRDVASRLPLGLGRSRSARVHQLRALGNACVPAQAAYAFVTLMSTLGAGGMSAPRVLACVWLPLQRAALCLNDETVFDVEQRECPICGSRTFSMLARWLAERA